MLVNVSDMQVVGAVDGAGWSAQTQALASQPSAQQDEEEGDPHPPPPPIGAENAPRPDWVQLLVIWSMNASF
jgi:hypothetical protein